MNKAPFRASQATMYSRDQSLVGHDGPTPAILDEDPGDLAQGPVLV